jgi:hypothetical protein
MARHSRTKGFAASDDPETLLLTKLLADHAQGIFETTLNRFKAM